MTPPLIETLAHVADAASGAADRWWIIGSAAVALCGGDVEPVEDVDLLMSAADAAGVLRKVGIDPRPGHPDARFRSAIFGTWRTPPIPVEVIGGLSVRAGAGWRDIALSTSDAVELAGRTVFVPSAAELARLLRTFGRPKDLERARLLGG